MNKYITHSKVQYPLYTPKPKRLPCKSECCQNSETKHDFSRYADDGTPLFTCRNCGEERSA